MDKVLEVQQQVKNNASDLNDYLRDLDSWTKQMQTKDEQLIQAKKSKKKDEQSVGSSGKSEKEKMNKDIKKEATPRKKPKIDPKSSPSSASLKSAKPRDSFSQLSVGYFNFQFSIASWKVFFRSELFLTKYWR